MEEQELRNVAAARRRRAQERKRRALDRLEAAEHAAEKTSDPRRSQVHRNEAETHLRAVAIQQQAAAMQALHAEAHQD